ncbi:nuclear poly(A) polymerase 3 isoform X2 [Magnolia sinica]|uniref:nuclear poly(A) polymerase 3 isoform X2 n=1 Tax=Magnolia sinica TaxID=86752 RepID=UPI00265A09ED|nr:nuclear poly(A) polymerase 3 isoform X2 [Magnolia sinica]
MAYAYPNQRRILVPGPQFVDPRTAIHPSGFLPTPFGVINPSFRLPVPPVEVLVPNGPPVFAPVRFALNPAVLIRMDEQRTQSLLQFMAKEGLVPSPEEESKRRDAIVELKKIVVAWVKKVAWQRRLPKNQIASTCATILTYGSYGLGVHGSESDIDALCVGPIYATMADFFIVLRNMLQSRPEVSELHCVKSAKVPLMRFKFNGISIDLPYAQLSVISVPENVDILNPFFLQNIDETSWRSLSGVRANIRLLQLVPNLENFQSMLRCIKLWARRRGLYSHLLGFFGGIHLAILSAHICQRHPNASISALISIFFDTFSRWPWPSPVTLQDGSIPYRDVSDGRSFMPIMMPCSPYDWCNTNITRSTFNRIRTEFNRGHNMTRDLGKPDFEWSDLFDPFPFTKRYTRFVRIFLAAPDEDELRDWLGWVKSRFRNLLQKLEEVQGYCDPNPTEYVDHEVAEPNTVFYWGLSPNRSSFTDIDSVKEEFMKSVDNGYQGSACRLELSIVNASQLPKNAQIDWGNGNMSKAYWRISDYIQQRPPVYSQHLPYYFVGYAAAATDRSE